MAPQPSLPVADAGDVGDVGDVGDAYEVTLRPTFMFVLVLGFGAATTTTGVVLVVEAVTGPGGVLGRLWGLGWGLVLIGLFGGGALVWAGQLLTGRPVLVLDQAGVRLVATWPRSRHADRVLAWAHVSRLHAYTQLTYHRGLTQRQHYLAFVPVDGIADQPASRLEDWAVALAGAPSVAALRYAVHVQPGWSATVEEVAEAARQYKPGLRLVDDRDLPPRRLRRWVRARAAVLGLATPPPASPRRPAPPVPGRRRRDLTLWFRAVFIAALLVLVYWTPWLLAEAAQQARIDRHQVRVVGVLTEVHHHRGVSARAVYTVQGRQVTSSPFPIQGTYAITGIAVCLEVDATRPTSARLCGFRGDLDRFQLLVQGAAITAATAGLPCCCAGSAVATPVPELGCDPPYPSSLPKQTVGCH